MNNHSTPPASSFPLCLLPFLFAMVAIASVAGAGERTEMENNAIDYRLRLTFAGGEAVARLADGPTTRDLFARLPLTLDFEDYIGKEKIAYLQTRLVSDGTSPRTSGDFAYYAPWGNLALFHTGSATAGGGLIVLGFFESGKEQFAAMGDAFVVTLSLMD